MSHQDHAPFDRDQLVLAVAWVDSVWKDGTMHLQAATLNVANGDCWRYPLDDAVVEELARVGREAWMKTELEDLPEESWASIVRAVMDRLVSGGPIR